MSRGHWLLFQNAQIISKLPYEFKLRQFSRDGKFEYYYLITKSSEFERIGLIKREKFGKVYKCKLTQKGLYLKEQFQKIHELLGG